MSDRYLRPVEVRRRFGIGRDALASMVEAKTLRPRLTPGGHKRYLESELLRAFETVATGEPVEPIERIAEQFDNACRKLRSYVRNLHRGNE